MKRIFLIVTTVVILAACSQGNKTNSAGNGKADCKKETVSLKFNNADFYTGGKFNEEAAKDAILSLMQYYQYPVTEKTRS